MQRWFNVGSALAGGGGAGDPQTAISDNHQTRDSEPMLC